MAENGFDRVATSLVGTLARMVDGNIHSTIITLQTKAIALQKTMFKHIAVGSGIIGADGAPTLTGISLPQPRFQELTPDYQKRKKLGRGENFFLYKGRLKKYLSQDGNPIGIFGKPMVYYTQPGQRNQYAVYNTQKTREGIKSQFIGARGAPVKNFRADKSKLGRISIDIFPNIKGDIELGMRMGDYFKRAPTIAYRLDNYRGGRFREFMPQFLQWWLRTKVKQMVRGTVKGTFK